MPHQTIADLPAARRQHLLIEFSSLRYAAPPGVYMSLSPNDARLWWGVLFVRKGPYKSGIFKFTIAFPTSYPSSAPAVTFHTPVFHPLIQPLLPSSPAPGQLSLLHGFPGWFALPPTPSGAPPFSTGPPDTVDLLDYIRSVFDSDAVLDAVPLSACANALGNEAAWRARNQEARGITDGWDERVRTCVEGSRSEGGVYGAILGKSNREGEEPIRFLEMDCAATEAIVENIKRAQAAKEAV